MRFRAHRNGLDAAFAFLAGAGAGALAMQWWSLPGSARGPDTVQEAQRQGSAAASLGRIHSLLGEIRQLMKTPAGKAPAGPRDPEPAADAASTGRFQAAAPARSSAPAEVEAAAEQVAGALKGAAGDAWRTPDRIGYGRDPFPGAAGRELFLAGGVAATGAAAAWAAFRKGGRPAAWSAAGGFAAAVLWTAWRAGMLALPVGSRGGAADGRMDGQRRMRRGRHALRRDPGAG